MLSFFADDLTFSQSNMSGKVEYIIRNSENFDVIQMIETSPRFKNMTGAQQNSAASLMSDPGAFVLYFNSKESIYHQHEMKESMEISNGRKRSKISFLKLFGGGSSIFYTRFSDNNTLVQENSIILEKEYLITYDFSKWKLLNESKKIGNYLCFKAVRNNTPSDLGKNKETVVWYTTEIPVRAGPKR